MNFKSILSAVGHGLKVFFTDAVKVAQVAEPVVNLLFPGVAPLFNATVAEIGKAEAVAIAAGNQTGSGSQKLALVLQAIEGEYNAFAKANNIPVTPVNVQAWVNAVVAALNTLPAAQQN
jgi:hypothetical protein